MSEIPTPWERAKISRSVQQERRTSNMPGARSQINSGRIWSSLRDNKLDTFVGMLLIDNKDTESESYRLVREKWLELRRDANRTPPGCHPALQVDIQDVHLMIFEVGLWDALMKYVIDLETRLMELEK
jgi:hypothetical protein